MSYRRSIHNVLGQFDESIPYYWDWDWYLRVARGGFKLCPRHGDLPVARDEIGPVEAAVDREGGAELGGTAREIRLAAGSSAPLLMIRTSPVFCSTTTLPSGSGVTATGTDTPEVTSESVNAGS